MRCPVRGQGLRQRMMQPRRQLRAESGVDPICVSSLCRFSAEQRVTAAAAAEQAGRPNIGASVAGMASRSRGSVYGASKGCSGPARVRKGRALDADQQSLDKRALCSHYVLSIAMENALVAPARASPDPTRVWLAGRLTTGKRYSVWPRSNRRLVEMARFMHPSSSPGVPFASAGVPLSPPGVSLLPLAAASLPSSSGCARPRSPIGSSAVARRGR